MFKDLKIFTEHNLDFENIHSKVIRLIMPSRKTVGPLNRDLMHLLEYYGRKETLI